MDIVKRLRELEPSLTVGKDCSEAADEIARLRDENAKLLADANECDALRAKLADILTRTANALKGEPSPLMAHSWHDLPERAQKLREDAARYRWVRDIAHTMDTTVPLVHISDRRGRVSADDEGFVPFLSYDELDSHIDAAMQKGE